jgi:hypothetical protein
MAGVLTTNSTVACGHSGNVTVTGTQKLIVSNNPVLVKAGIAGKTILDCQTIEPANDPSGTPTGNKCKNVSSVSSGEATKLKVKVNGQWQAVMLDTLSGTTDGMVAKITPQLLLSAKAEQTKLTAI